ncbi:MAG: SDR family oxidoreductase [Propionibacteriaceae bacterium]|nr:SDR family oxidoreductase [Propionibacteriaceae bacterium]
MPEKSTKPVIAVSGGGQGIGRGILLYFAERGHDVAIVDVDQDQMAVTAADCEALGAQALVLPCDVTQSSQVDAAYAQLAERYGRLDVQVNNAGILRRQRIMDSTDEVTQAVIGVNVFGVINTARAAMRIMVPQGSGNIITAHSLLGDRMPDAGLGVYSATKAFVASLTRVMAAECAPYGIRVNGYAPSVTDSAMVHHIIEERPVAKLDQISMREFGRPEQVGKICWFLCSDLAEYTTGASIPTDGGSWLVQRPFLPWEAAGKIEPRQR